ncbi:MAG: iron ABC transporter permease [Hahellaceae bacterium]|nr:iron ABC transporter permease [Hahellaceae bacterium]
MLLLCLPVAAILWLAANPEENPWPHLLETVLPNYLYNTFALLIGVGACSVGLGFSLAWLFRFYDFPLKRFFSWALLLPFAMPAYIMAYVYTDFLSYTGPLQAMLRKGMGWTGASEYTFPEIRSLGGAIAMFSLVLYPYVFLTARASLQNVSDHLIQAARSLGASPLSTLLRVVFPSVRPALAIGLALVSMETLNDYGTVSYFAIPTLTFGLYDAWLTMGNVGGAAQIALVLISVTLVLVLVEWLSRNRGMRQASGTRPGRQLPQALTGWRSGLVLTYLTSLLLIAFAVPFCILLYYAVSLFEQNWTPRFTQYAINSMSLAASTVILLSLLSLMIAYVQRIKAQDRHLLTRIAMLGYAMPGAVLAIGVLVPLGGFDNWLSDRLTEYWGISSGLLFSGTVFALLYAYSCRFFTVSFGSVESGLMQITPAMDQVAQTLGCKSPEILRRIHLPLLRPALLSSAIIIFVDVIKELPATLLLRPFNFETLATYVYQYASDEMIHHSALAALLIVAIGIVPAILLNRFSETQKNP